MQLSMRTWPQLSSSRKQLEAIANRSLYSTQVNGTNIGQLDSSQLRITKTTTPKPLTPAEKLVFGCQFTGSLCFSAIFALYYESNR